MPRIRSTLESLVAGLTKKVYASRPCFVCSREPGKASWALSRVHLFREQKGVILTWNDYTLNY